MGTAGDIDEDLLLESGDGSPEKAGNEGNDDISHLGKRKIIDSKVPLNGEIR